MMSMSGMRYIVEGEVGAFFGLTMFALWQFQWLDLDYRCTLMPHQLEAFKIATEARLNQRQLCLTILLATLLGALCSWIGVLACYYTYGASSSHVDSWRTSMGSSP